MKNTFLRLLLLTLLLPAFACTTVRQNATPESGTVSLTVMSTTDLHGWVVPWDYYTDIEDKRYGLARVATLVDSIRARVPHTLLLDAGDWMQGNPMAEFYGRHDTLSPYPLLRAADLLEFDAIAIGNHEFNFGIDLLRHRIEQTRSPIIAANIYHAGTHDPAFEPYVIRDVDGVRVGILGLTTPGSAVWDRVHVEGRLDFGDGLEAAQRFVPLIQEEGAEVIIVLMHSGLDGATSYFDENLGPEHFGRQVAENVEGIDLIVLGHTHTVVDQVLEGPGGKRVPAIQAGRWGSHLALAELTVRRNGIGVDVVSARTDIISAESVPASSRVEALVREEHQQVRNFMNQAVGTTADVWDGSRSRLEPTAIIDLVHAAQLRATGAQLSAAASFNPAVRMGPGAITLGQVTRLYPYENSLFTIEITGLQLRQYLEHTSRHFSGVDEQEAPVVNPSWPGFNFDMIYGVEYDLDIRREPGARVVRLDYDGRPVRDSDRFTLAVNSYRAQGGGGFDMIADAPVLAHDQRAVRDLIVDYLRDNDPIAPADIPRSSWRLISGPDR
jgi:2',3'-cyclic-nucleotide 2'-phosphodiesterase / 3'-nucleotidase